MDINQIIITILTIVGALRLIFKGLEKIVQLTETEKDDKIVSKALKALKDISEILSLPETKSDLNIKVKE